jgi:hypothetical protein
MSVVRAVGAMSVLLVLSSAAAQQPAQQAVGACNASNRGTVNCPTYTAPATTAVPRAPMDGSKVVPATTSTTLFNGAVPPNGFMVQTGANAGICWVNDNGSASGEGAISLGGPFAGFEIVQSNPAGVSLFVTPPGYKPIGVVSVWCTLAGYVAARGW